MATNRARTKKGRTSKKKGQLDTPLDAEKWQGMKPFGSFLINDKDDNIEHMFKKEDIATILPNGREPGTEIEEWEYWVATIKDIRAQIHPDGTNTVWAKVQWYYSGKDVADVIKSFKAATVGRFERIYADHYDFIESESFDAVVSVINFDENDPEQEFIARNQFYRRYTFEYKARTLKPKPGSSGCLCQNPYNPNDNSHDMIMHFCPRPSCRRAYHQSCLLAAKSKESSSTSQSQSVIVSNPSTPSQKPALRSARKHASPVVQVKRTLKIDVQSGPSSSSRALRLLACSPDTNDVVDLESLIPLTVVSSLVPDDDDDSNQPPKKKRRGRPSKKAPTSTSHEAHVQQPRSLAAILAEIPPALLETAQQPMVRGGAFVSGGISGNLAFVTRARRLVYQILEGSALPEDWEELVFGPPEDKLGVANAIVKLGGARKALPPVVCPECKSAI